jgi:hypothetical protein
MYNSRTSRLKDGMVGPFISRSPFLILFSVLLVGCNFPSTGAEFTPDGPATLAAHTLEAVFTNVAEATDGTSGETPTALPSDNHAGTTTVTPESTCTDKAAFMDDITVRDNTQIETGQSFVKIWRLRNVGTCIWDQDYNLAFMGGERMGSPLLIPLSSEVQPGQSVDLMIDMTAPDQPGIYQGFWRLRSSNGRFFGIGTRGDQSFWVKIVVVILHSATPSPTSTPSNTPASPIGTASTPTPSNTPQPTAVIHKQGSNQLEADQSIDLDLGELSPISGGDLELAESTPTELSLLPMNGALFALYLNEATPPDSSDCGNILLDDDPIPITGLAVDDILCYSTDEGRLGYLLITRVDSTIRFDFTTWVP